VPPQAPVVERAARELARILATTWSEIVAESERAVRAGASTERLDELRRSVEQQLARLEGQTRTWLRRRFPAVYRAGAEAAAADVGVTFSWTVVHTAALNELAADLYEDVLKSTRYVRRDVKRFIREAARQATRRALLGRTAQQEGRRLARFLSERGLHAVRYRNGARVGLDDYGDMLVRTKSALAYNEGTLNVGREHGVVYYEVFDGPGCGWSTHNDGQQALGMIVTEDEARAFPISHPRCRRAFGARPDLVTPEAARAAQGGQTTKRQTQAQLRQDEARRAAQRRRRQRRQRRERRART